MSHLPPHDFEEFSNARCQYRFIFAHPASTSSAGLPCQRYNSICRRGQLIKSWAYIQNNVHIFFTISVLVVRKHILYKLSNCHTTCHTFAYHIIVCVRKISVGLIDNTVVRMFRFDLWQLIPYGHYRFFTDSPMRVLLTLISTSPRSVSM